MADVVTVLTSTPSLRAKLFADPMLLGGQIPSARKWRYAGKRRRQQKRARQALVQAVMREAATRIRQNQLAAAVDSDSVYQESFRPIVNVSQWSFRSVLVLSWLAFFVGVGLIVVGARLALDPVRGTDPSVVSSVFGAGGALTSLGAIFAASKQGIREATIDHVRLRLVLAGFATQLAQLRGLAERPIALDSQAEAPGLPKIAEINGAIAKAIDAAIESLQTPASQGKQNGKTGDGTASTAHTPPP